MTGGVDQITSVESIRLGTSDNPGTNNTVVVKSLDGLPTPKDATTIDLGATLYSSNDTLDFTQYGTNVYLGTTTSADGQGQAAGLFKNEGMTASTGLSFAGMTTIDLGTGNDIVNLTTAADPYLHTINGGAGNDKIKTDNVDVTINLGNGTDLVGTVGRGTVVNAGQGTDTFTVSNDELIVGSTNNDVIVDQGGEVLHGYVGPINSDSPWITSIFDGISYGINSLGQLAIKDTLGNITYVGGYQGGINVPWSQLTDGIFVGRGEFEYRGLFSLPRPYGDEIPLVFKLGNEIMYTMTGKPFFPGSNDPLVLDLTGNGVNLTGESSVSTMFDMQGTGFAVHTGWTQPGTGLLVIENANGQVENINQLVGSENNSGFAALAQFDSNGDGVIDANDPIYSQLRVWQDTNADGVAQPGELETLAQAGIASINVSATAQTGMSIAGNAVNATGTFTWTNGSTGAIDDVALTIDPFHSRYLGDTTVSAAAAALPNLMGHGTLTDLQVAMTLDPTLIDVMNANLPNLDQLDFTALRNAAMPIFDAWARAVQLPDANGNLHTVDPAAGHSDVPVLLDTDPTGATIVDDFAYRVTDSNGTYFKLASGNPVKDAQGNVIAFPTFNDVMAQTPAKGTWTDFTADQIGFMERYLGEPLPIDTTTSNPGALLSAMSSFISGSYEAMNLEAVRLAMQGPLASYFPTIVYDATSDHFHATTDAELSPMYEAIFKAAPSDPAGAMAWLTAWKPIIDIVLGDFDRGEGLQVSFAYMFASMVHAYEDVGLPLSIADAAGALGVPENEVVTGGATLTGTADTQLFYLSGGDQTVNDVHSSQNFIMGANFGHDVINADQGASGQQDVLRFTNVKSTDVTASRSGIDLTLTVNATGQSVTLPGEFIGAKPGLFGGNINDIRGANEIVFSDGVVWDMTDIAWAVAEHTQVVNDSIIGADGTDVLDGSLAHYLSGGNGSDIYLFGRGDGNVTIEAKRTDPLETSTDYLKFGPDITMSDLTFSRQGNSDDLQISINGTSDTLTIIGQFAADYNIFGPMWLDRINTFLFADGSSETWEDVIKNFDAADPTSGKAQIYGFDYPDILDGGPGIHYISGGNENKTYIFDFNHTYDIVENATTNILSGMNRTIQFGADVTPQDVTFSRVGDSNDLLISLSDGSTMLVKGEFSVGFSGQSNLEFDRIENFQFGDGTTLTYDQILATLTAQAVASGSDVYGTDYGETFTVGVGDQYFNPGLGNNTIVFGHSSGHGTVEIPGVGANTVQFAADVSPSDVTWSRLGNDLIIKLNGSNASLNILGEFGFTNVSSFQFADGTTLTNGDIYTLLHQGTAGGDFVDSSYLLNSNLPHPAVTAGPGDVLMGTGSDVFQFNVGDGRDVILDPVDNGTSEIDFGASITPDMVHVHQVGDGVVFTFDGTNDRITWVDSSGLGRVVFADGTIWSASDIAARTVAGTTLQTMQNGQAATPSFNGGNYEVDYNVSSGYATYAQPENQPGTTVTLRVSGIDPNDLDIQRVRFTDYSRGDYGASILISAKDLTSGGLLVDALHAGSLPFDQIVFDDGTTWTRAQVEQALIDQASASTGNTQIYGWSGDDTITAGTGDDILSGGNGNDTYVYYRGDGFDRIETNKQPGSGYVDKLLFPDLASTDVTIERLPGSGIDNLVISIDGKNGSPQGQITIQDEFDYKNNPTDTAIAQIQFSDGVVWTEPQIEAMLLAQEEAQGPGAVIYGFDGNDTLTARTTTTVLTGGLGADTYVWTAGDGATFISDQGSNDHSINPQFADTLEIRGIDPSKVTVTRSPDPTSHDLILTMAGQNPIVLENQTAPGSNSVIDKVVFDNGTVWDYSDLILAADGGVATTPNGTTARAFDGTPATATLTGTSSNDVYFWGAGDGNDTIAEIQADPWVKADVVRLVGLNPGDVQLQIVENSAGWPDLRIINKATGETLTVLQQFSGASHDGSDLSPGGGNGIEKILFADGTEWNAEEILQNSSYVAGPGVTAVYNLDYGDGTISIEASPGVTTLNGLGDKADTYVWQPGDGNITINDYASGAPVTNTLRLMGIAESAVLTSRVGNDLVITDNLTNETITVKSEFPQVSSGNGIDQIVFDDGTVWDRSQINLSVAIIAGVGDKYLTGLAGDTFIYTSAGGNDVVDDGNGGTLLMQDITSTGVTLSRNGPSNDIVLTVTATGKTVTLKNEVDPGYVGLIVNFSDGVAWNRDQIEQMLLDQESAANGGSVYGYYGKDDTIVAGLGDKYLNGLSGNDTYIYTSAGGNDIIDDTGGTLAMQDIASTGVTLSRPGPSNDVVLTVTATGKTLTLKNDFDPSFSGFTISFSDGVTWSRDQIEQMLLDQESAANGGSVYGYYGKDDTIVAGLGDKYLNGLSGNDTYIYTSAGGNDIIDDAGGTLVMQDIASTGITLSRLGPSNDVVLTVTATGKTLTVKNDFDPSFSGFTINFSDGVTWSRDQIEQMLLDQESAANGGSVYGYYGKDDTIVAGLGDKYLNGLSGNDTYIYTSAGGNDIIDDDGGTLVMQDIASTGVTLSRTGPSNDVELTVTATGKTMMLKNEFVSYFAGLTINFSDGVSWSRSQIEQMLLNQESAANGGSVYGYSGNDTLVAGPGDKYLNGEGGSDTYVYSSYDGNDIVDDPGNGLSTLQFSDIASTDVSLARLAGGNNLIITVNSTGKTVTVDNELSSSSGSLKAITFSDGVSWNQTQIENILSGGSGGSSGGQFNLGAGHVTLNSSDTVIDMGTGITPDEVLLQADGWGNLTIALRGDSSDYLTLNGDLANNSWGVSSILRQLVFTNGAVLDIGQPASGQGQPISFTWVGSSSVTSFTGSNFGSNIFDVAAGGDNIQFGNSNSGGSGLNTIEFAEGDGHVTVSNVNNGTGIIQFGTGITAGNVLLQADGWGNLTVALRGDSSDYITVNGDLHNNAWGVSSNLKELEFSDGTMLAIGQPAAGQGIPITFTWVGSSNASLTGSNFGANVFDVAAGDSIQFGNTSSGGNGQNTIEFNAGDGHVTVSNVNNGTGIVQFGAGITAADVLLQADGWGNLTVALRGDSSDSITVNGDLHNNAWGVSSNLKELEFSDGTMIGIGQPAAGQGSPITFTWVGSSNTSLTGSNFGANVFDVAAGDSIQFGNASSGGNGQNTIEFAEGDGRVTVSNVNNGTGAIQFGAGITAADVLLEADGWGNLTVALGGDSSDFITVNGDLHNNAWGVSSNLNELQFSDGTTIAIGQPAAGQGTPITFTWVASSTNTSLTGSNFGANVFDVAPGGDSIQFGNTSSGGSGQNTILFGRGDGNATVNLNNATGVIQFGAGISASDVLLQNPGWGNLTISLRGDSTDSITVNNDLTKNSWGVSSGINQLKFSDGSVENIGQPAAGQGSPITFDWVGTPNASITGSNFGSNTFELGGGTESFTGGTTNSGGNGNNSYLASSATGQATIYANASTGTTNELDFTGGISDENLWFIQNGNNLKIDLMGTNTSVTVNNWFSGGSNQLQEITAGGLKIDSQISQLVQAMATYSTNNSGFDPTSSSHTSVPNDTGLQTAIGAAWHA